MRRLALTATLVLLAAAQAALAAGTWSRTYSDEGDQQALDTLELADGRLLVAGSFAPPADKGRGWRLGLDPGGELESQQSWAVRSPPFGAPSTIDAASITPDGSVFFAGRNIVDLFLTHHVWAARLDPSGTLLWSLNLSLPVGRLFLFDAVQTLDGGVVAAGSTSLSDAGPRFVWVVKLDDAGDLVWQNWYGAGPEHAQAIIETSDGGFAVAGRSAAGAGLGDAWLAKLDAGGVLEWTRTFGGPQQDEASALVELSGGGYALAGWTGSFSASGRAAWALVVTADGELERPIVFGDTEWSDFEGVELLDDGAVLLVGRVNDGSPVNALWVVKLWPEDGTVDWQRAYEDAFGAQGTVASELADGALLVSGIWAAGFEDEALRVMRLGPEGTMGDCELVRETAVTSTSPRITVGPGEETVEPATALAASEVMELTTTAAERATQCEVPPCPDQGNVLLAVKTGDALDVWLQFAGAPAEAWRVYRDPAKHELGLSPLEPDVDVPSFTDPGAVPAGSDSFYVVRGLCDGVPGP